MVTGFEGGEGIMKINKKELLLTSLVCLLPLLAGVVLFYQTAGALGEWAFTGSAAAAVQDFRIGIPGMLAQAAGGYLIINYLLRK